MPASRWDVRLSARGWTAGLLVLAVSVGSSVFFTLRQRPLYRASASLVVAPTSAVRDTGDILRSLDTLERRSVIATFARLPGSPAVQQAAAQKLGLGTRLSGCRVSALVLPNTNILRIDVEGSDPQRVAAAANAVALVMRDEVRSLYRVFTLRPLAEAAAPSEPFFPDPRRNVVVGAVLGLFLGALVALVVGRAGPFARADG